MGWVAIEPAQIAVKYTADAPFWMSVEGLQVVFISEVFGKLHILDQFVGRHSLIHSLNGLVVNELNGIAIVAENLLDLPCSENRIGVTAHKGNGIVVSLYGKLRWFRILVCSQNLVLNNHFTHPLTALQPRVCWPRFCEREPLLIQHRFQTARL
ncbi:hypothetical protein CA54_42040 [Symmachiella macrocystis]|uniref:Uncharacterized protein n=1 Tax=Symmachiella macrocystis TaxID=2527985 RepID=A0A5C6B9L4_9PLAN|nr:hypothetical protein CA54_42040 [Symmachiella macrocystis]